MAHDNTRIMGLMISSRETERAHQVIREGIEAYFRDYAKDSSLPDGFESEIILLDGYRKGGYGKYDDDIERCIREEYCRDGIPLDPIYTAKAFWGMKQYLKDQGITGKKILFLHTGGAPLFYDYLQR